jgi:hypothetical protein
MFNSIGRLAFALDGKNQMVLISPCWLAASRKDPLSLSWSTISVAWIGGLMLADWSQLQSILKKVSSYLKLSTCGQEIVRGACAGLQHKLRADMSLRRCVVSPMPICTTQLCIVPIPAWWCRRANTRCCGSAAQYPINQLLRNWFPIPSKIHS